MFPNKQANDISFWMRLLRWDVAYLTKRKKVACSSYRINNFTYSPTLITHISGAKKKFGLTEIRVIKTEYFEHKVSQKHYQELVTRLVCHLCVVCFLFVCFFKCSFSISCFAMLRVSHAVLCVYLASSFDPWLWSNDNSVKVVSNVYFRYG